MTNRLNTTNLMNTVLCTPDDTWVIFDRQGVVIEQGKGIEGYCTRLYNDHCCHKSQGNDSNQFTEGRYAIALLEGEYHLDIDVGYYTSILGMAQKPDDVVVHGKIQVPNSCNGWALDNFWRSCEGVRIKVSGDGKNYWRVSQAAPFRRNIVDGTLILGQHTEEELGYASGGFIGECVINPVGGEHGDIDMGTQQQFYIGTSKFKQLRGGAWNFLMAGNASEAISHQEMVQGKKLNTVIDAIPTIAGKPYLIAHSIHDFELAIPKIKNDVKGSLSYGDNAIEKTKNFTIVDPLTSLDQINTYLSEGVSIVFSPGIYEYAAPIVVSQPNTVLLGLSYATIIPTHGREAIITTATGCRIAGLMVQAGAVPKGSGPSPSLIAIGGTNEKTAGDIENPTVLQDVYCRVGGPDDDGACSTMLLINQSHTLLENTWNWRADHTDHVRDGLGVDKAKVDHCLIVNGDHVTCYCLMIEHTLKELCIWNGDHGKIFFIQSELAYDVGDYPSLWDYPGLRINGNHFFGTALGFYSFFSKSHRATKDFPMVSSAIITRPDSKIDSAMTVFLDPTKGGGRIAHVINDMGQKSDIDSAGIPSWCSYNNVQMAK